MRFSALIKLFKDNAKIKWVILAVSTLVIVGSVYFTNRLVNQLKEREQNQVRLYARALEYMANQEINDILFITQEIISKNNSIPTLLTDADDRIISHNNISLDESWTESKKQSRLAYELKMMKREYPPVEIILRDPDTGEVFGRNFVYYRNSKMLAWLRAFPYIQLTVLAVLGFITYLAFNYSRLAEQNSVWVGLTKETAHQLGTPLSSLMAWIEMLRDMPEMRNKGIVDELDKDTRKLRIVAERFSSIGSKPTLKEVNVVALVNNVIDYFQSRVSSKINFEVDFMHENICARAHAPLLEWVIENMCRNAVDAIASEGLVAIKILYGSGRRVFVDITDNGKGMSPRLAARIFDAGVTTKKRGWGLGLTLAKRIIEMYHNGRIYVRSSQEKAGTTFRLELSAA